MSAVPSEPLAGATPESLAGATPEPLAGATPRCPHCGEVFGVYEPLVHVIGSLARRTSRAARPHLLSDRHGLLYHAACYELIRSPTASTAG